MRIGRRQIDRLIRPLVVVAACLTVAAMTSGLLLMIHVGDAEHHEEHDSHRCSLCQQLLLAAREFITAQAAVSIGEPEGCLPGTHAANEPALSHRLAAARPRSPPPILPYQSV